MKVEIKLSHDLPEAYAIIYTPTLTEEITSFVNSLENSSHTPITAKQEDTLHIIASEDLYMVRVENQQVILYTKNAHYTATKKLYEVESQLNSHFLRISKTTLVNLKQLDSVEPSFNGTMYLKLKNGCKDYISRKYLPDFKKYLGL
ncbi:MAG: LytTR family DNA-binding domain-containing protein [Cellulosilyticaceae bacterium]